MGAVRSPVQAIKGLVVSITSLTFKRTKGG
jgi:hypothetical protein